MTERQPVYTARTECQDCYRCIRECSVKAIKVASGYASVIPELCVCCGHCVAACPHSAKKVRSDRGVVEKLIAAGVPVAVSLAPSYISEFEGVRPGQIVSSLKLLGFAAVSETALGAQEVSAHLAEDLRGAKGGLRISSACPVAVEYIQKFQPHLTDQIVPLLSPALSHARLLKQELGESTQVVFIGPCIAKKREADLHPELLAAALTFVELRQWLEDRKIEPEAIAASEEDRFVPEPALEGSLYPVEGGMLEGVRALLGGAPAGFMSFSGFSSVQRALEGLENCRGSAPLLLELLACEGGCVNGPKARVGAAVAKRSRVVELSAPADAAPPRRPRIDIGTMYEPRSLPVFVCTDAQLREALRSIGKVTLEDELNCGGCGYDSCRQFAEALAEGRAERQMCVGYMRKLAQKKMNVLMQRMPSGVVIVDDQLRIVESNPRFNEFFVEDGAGGADPAGTELASIVPFHNLFRQVLTTDQEIFDRQLRYRGRVFSATVFTIEPGSLVGGIIRDSTRPALEKEQIIRRAREVIQRHLTTVQQIAYLLGENAAESEMTLNEIVQSFSPADIEPPHGGD
jgi:iron only hydrogenase large subunit-like protein